MTRVYKLPLEEKEFQFEIGVLATQADCSVMCSCGDTKILSSLCIGDLLDDFPIGEEFTPLTCEYRERSSAVGKIPGGFIKREGKPSDNEVLISRLIDRPIRPIIPKGFFYDTQLISLVFSADKENPPDILCVNASALAILLSSINILTPVAAVRVCKTDNKFVLNPSMDIIKESPLNIVIAGTKYGITMLEGEAREIPEAEIISAIEYGYANILKILNFQEMVLQDVGKNTTKHLPLIEADKELYEKLKAKYFESFRKAFEHSKKKERNEELDKLKKKIVDEIMTENPSFNSLVLSSTLGLVEKEVFMNMVEGNKRFDGRGLNDLREITCQVGLLPRAHGSALFVRGETQALASVTLGTKFDQQIIDGLYDEEPERFLVHYNFLPFSVGEVRPLRSPSRREIGHGNLARKALEFTIPTEEQFPQTIRIVSDILSSNGSSSMATVCAGSLAMMDAGIPVKKHIAGVALGLITINELPYILTDIIGAEDRYGEMDFKVAGSQDGITAIQLDVKNKGLSFELLKKAFEQSKSARLYILELMHKCIKQPRPKISPYAPQIRKMPIPLDKIGLLIGPGGKTIRQIQELTGSKLEIADDTGELYISANNEKELDAAMEAVSEIIGDLKEGKIYKVRVKAIKDFGAVVETLSGVEGLVHISEITKGYVRRIEDYLKVGQIVNAMMIEKDELGRYRFSIKRISNL
jgi:polyribonucleotide nucleotidyltransferase